MWEAEDPVKECVRLSSPTSPWLRATRCWWSCSQLVNGTGDLCHSLILTTSYLTRQLQPQHQLPTILPLQGIPYPNKTPPGFFSDMYTLDQPKCRDGQKLHVGGWYLC